MAVSPLPRPEADTLANLLMSAMLSCPEWPERLECGG